MEKKASILIVDDDANTRRSLSLIFQEKGYRAETAGMGQEAIEKAQGRFFNLALLDIRLPDMEGVELLAPLKEMHPDIELIMATAYASLETAARALNEGASAYVTKPLNMDEVLAIVREALKKQHLAMENKRLYQVAQRELAERKRAEEELQESNVKLKRALEGTVYTLTSVIEMRDPHTAGHQQRVTQLACAIAERMGLSTDRIEGVRVAGLIHDVGKISIPAQVLSKPGRLNELEWGMIQTHPQVGYDVLKTVEFPWPVAQTVLQHHERIDGSGYPHGLSGEEITVEARILAVADVVAAMTSHRPYRSARTLDKALEEISQNRGILYDPEIVDACLKLFTERGFAFE